MLKRQQVLRLENSSQIDPVKQSVPIPVHKDLVQLLARLIARNAISSSPSPQKERSHDARDE